MIFFLFGNSTRNNVIYFVQCHAIISAVKPQNYELHCNMILMQLHNNACFGIIVNLFRIC